MDIKETSLADLISRYKAGLLYKRIILLTGEDGLGQKDVLYQFIESAKMDNAICIDLTYSPMRLPFTSIWSSLSEHLNIEKNYLDSYISLERTSGNYTEFLFSAIVDLCKKNKTIVFFSGDINKSDENMTRLIENIFEYILQDYNTIFIGCNYTNKKDNPAISSLISQNTFITNELNFFRWKSSEIKQLFFQKFNNNIIIQEYDLKKIVSCSMGNPGKLYNIIDYLISEQIISKKGDLHICRNFDHDLLIFKAQKYVIEQYERLESDLQKVIRSASVLGFEFDSNLLRNPLNFINSEQYLYNIEKITSIINKRLHPIYEFYNEETYLSIKNIVKPSEFSAWCTTLAQYYYTEAENNIKQQNLIAGCNFYLSSAFYYKELHQHNMSISIYHRVVPILISLMYYGKALEVIREIENISIEKNIYLHPIMRQNLSILKAHCLFSTFDFEDASKQYQYYLNNVLLDDLESKKIRCQYAMSLYLNDETESAYSELTEIYDGIVMDVTQDNASLIVDTLSYMSSIEETLRSPDCKTHFDLAVKYAHKYKLTDKYYSLLRKSFIAYSEINCLNLLKTAGEYYKTTGNIKEYAMTLHNIASFTLLYGDIDDVKGYCDEAIELFKQIGSDSIHCTYNCIGIYWMLKGDFKTAISFFKSAYKKRIDLFSKITILLNQLSAYQKLGNYKRASRTLRCIDQLWKEQGSDSFKILKPYYYLTKALFYQEVGKKQKSYESYTAYFDCKYESNSFRYIFAAKKLYELCEDGSLSYPANLTEYTKRKNEVAERFLKYNIIPAHIAFAE